MFRGPDHPFIISSIRDSSLSVLSGVFQIVFTSLRILYNSIVQTFQSHLIKQELRVLVDPAVQLEATLPFEPHLQSKLCGSLGFQGTIFRILEEEGGII